MLKQRVITALALLAVLVPSLIASSIWPFGLVSLVVIGLAGWEWSRLNGHGGVAAMAWGGTLAVACLIALWVEVPSRVPAGVWWALSGLWVLGGAWALKVGVPGWPRLWPLARLGLGWIILGTSWMAMSAAKAQGVGFLASVLAVVWMADIAAYFGGRAWGRRKLAVSISPGKSWEGVYTGLCAVVVLSVAWVLVERLGPAGITPGSFLLQVQARFGWAVLVLTALYVAVLSVMGDLLESLVKRSAGAKDSSSLLPGHGGMLDRIDALLPVFPAVMALTLL